MTENHDPPIITGTIPTTLFDAWCAPFTFWANWCSFYAEALHTAQLQHPGNKLPNDTAPVHIEEEEGLVA
ncbi:hypothetical protein [Sphingobium sp.]|uniref:hypothetical protein n=1 Tax=Sphingobium sp. TaxID=1912891 RepID=UPI002B77A857|nr:hypothetical protein [Sphingobium sp.]HUD91893.1 hypothetical protein [Sphingobium sp.]